MKRTCATFSGALHSAYYNLRALLGSLERCETQPLKWPSPRRTFSRNSVQSKGSGMECSLSIRARAMGQWKRVESHREWVAGPEPKVGFMWLSDRVRRRSEHIQGIGKGNSD